MEIRTIILNYDRLLKSLSMTGTYFDNNYNFEHLKRHDHFLSILLTNMNATSQSDRFLIDFSNKNTSDIYRFYRTIKTKYCKKVKVIVGIGLSSIIDSYENNLTRLKYSGKQVKDTDYTKTREYEKFKDTLDRLFSYRQLNDFQLKNSYFAYKVKKSANFSVPGSGKTSTILGLFAYLKYEDLVDTIVVIGPKSCYLSWCDEYTLCFHKEPDVVSTDVIRDNLDYLDKLDDDKLKALLKKYNMAIFNYESVEKNQKFINALVDKRTLLVFDESHKIKNPGGKWAKACLNILNDSEYRVLLTGTPLPNGYEDAYNLLKIIGGDFYDELFGFKIDELKKSSPDDAFFVDVFKSKIYPFFIRTTKDDLKVPKPNKDHIITYNLCPDEEKLYQEVKELYADIPFGLIVRLLQTLSCPKELVADLDISIFNDEEIDDNIKKQSLGKITDKRVVELVHKVGVPTKIQEVVKLIHKLVTENKNVLVWTIFLSPMKELKELISQFTTCEIINGSVDNAQRNQIIKRFQNNEIRVLIANPQTIAESVSLHKNCHDAIYVDYSYNLTHMLQSKDRIHRLGISQDTQTNYYYFNASNEICEIENIIYETLKDKEAMMNEIINSKEINVSKDNKNSEAFINEIYDKLNVNK